MTVWTDAVLNQGPTAAFFFEEEPGTGTLAGYDGTREGTVYGAQQGVTAATGNFGRGIRFDGVDDYAEIPYAADLYPGSTGPFTMLAVFTATTIDNTFRRLFSFENGSNGINMHANSNTSIGLRGERWASGINQNLAYPGALNDSRSKIYVAHLVYDGSTMYWYTDTTLHTWVNTTVVMENPLTPLSFGRRGFDNSRYWHGDLYTWAYYDRALTGEERTAQYDAGYAVQTTQEVNRTDTINLSLSETSEKTVLGPNEPSIVTSEALTQPTRSRIEFTQDPGSLVRVRRRLV